MNKKGFLFTVLAVMFVLVIITMASTQQRLYPRSLSQAQRIHTMDSYLSNLEQDLPRAAYIAGFRGLIGTEEHVTTTGKYLTNFDTDFKSIFSNGTINNTFYGIMNNSTFNNFTQRFQLIAQQQGMLANLSVVGVSAYQEDPWYVTINVTVNTTIKDTADTVRFETLINVTTRVPIDGVKDPVYAVGTQGRAPHTISRSNITRPYITATNDTTNLQLLVNQTLYINSTYAPSFIQRFTGDFNASPFGIMSLVNIKELEAQSIAIDDCKSVVDFLYFGSSSTQNNYYIINMPQESFWINSTEFPDLDATGKTVGVKPCP